MALRIIRVVFVALLVVASLSPHAWAGFCDQVWDGDMFMSRFADSPAATPIELNDSNKNTVAIVTHAQVGAFHAAKERIAQQEGRSPALLICSGRLPNAFAMTGDDGDLIAITIGMLKLIDGNRDQAAYVIGHEIAHHVLNHNRSTATRETLAGLLELVAGIALEKKAQRHRLPGVGFDIANIGRRMVTAKFDRDQEREADDYGLEYMVKAGYDPSGAIRFVTTMERMGLGGAGLFFDTHPGWVERAERLQAMLDQHPDWSQKAYASQEGGRTRQSQATTPSAPVTLVSNAELPSHQALFNEAVQFVRAGNNKAALNALDSFLDADPGDLQGQFLRGLVLTNLERRQDAIGAFRNLTTQHPELPEPHNNLAALYAATGNYELARTSLQQAIRANPEYATAHENLGDLYVKMASLAFDRSLQLTGDNPKALLKLKVMQQVLSVDSSARQ